ncbi:phage portal protein [Solibacillus sp. FSL H8-0523]|uniref:phage portal protein n=1 Tax=Solibacillus sp. FSL H8-0523 TaxID=2954511 RepID=UPI0031015806
MNTQKYVRQFRDKGADATLIAQVIDEHQKDKARRLLMYKRYRAETDAVPILTREAAKYEDFETGAVKRIDDKVNNRLNNSFDVEIVDTKVGYMFGHPISYEVDKNVLDKLTGLKAEIDIFKLRNNVEDKDSEWGKKAAICGYGARLAYIDKEGKERIINIDPWETIIISSTDYTEPEFAIRYFNIDENKQRVEFYDDAFYYVFESGANGLQLIDKPQLHTFEHCPLFGLPNNEELMADAERVFTLIDAYNRTLSDASNEIEQYRLAYLILKGLGADDEDIDRIKKSGIFELLGENDDVRYLTKDINDSLIEHHLDRLEQNIMRLAKSVNFSDEAFGGNVTGVALEFKLMSLENKCITMERKMTAALRYQFKVLCSAWAKKGLCADEDYLKIWFEFKRNIPVNMKERVETAVAMMAIASHKTALSTLPNIDDAEYEMEQRQLELDAIKPMMADDDEDGDDDGSGEVQ